MEKLAGVKVFAPATIANLAVGYDILGLAFNGPGDVIIFNQSDSPGLKIDSISGDQGKLPKSILENTAGFAAKRVLEESGMKDISCAMQIYKKMPFGSGMGSSAASAVAGAFGMNEFLSNPFTREELLPFAVEAEQLADGAYHADNVAPSLFGGIVLLRDNKTLDFIKLPCPIGLSVVLIYPHVQVLTKDSREVLSNHVPLKDHVLQSGNLAAFIVSLYRSDFDLLGRSLEDLVIEPQRAKLIPHFYDLKKIAIDLGALGFSISGAGPSMFAICNNSIVADNIKETVALFMKEHKIQSDIYCSPINLTGAFKF